MKGNPNPSPETRFSTDREQPLEHFLGLRINQGMKDALHALGDEKNEFIREAIATALKKSK